MMHVLLHMHIYTSKLSTHLFQRSVMILLREKVYVSGRNDAHQLAAHLAGFCNWDPRETMAYLGLEHVPHCVSWTHHHWVCNKALLEFLAKTKTQALRWSDVVCFGSNVGKRTGVCCS